MASAKTGSVTIAANATANATATITKANYTPIGVVGWQSFSTTVFAYNCYVGNSTTAYMGLKNISTASVTGSMTLWILYRAS